ncbi:MAG TPA: AI-2E family transporter [Candidatus Magasanikbacteria bacterium]|nr:AI-2E family transporter [Candidatus Magasanikbacteria bacterium]
MPKISDNFARIRTIFFFSLIIILGIALLYVISPFIYPIFWAAVIAVLAHPTYKKLLKFFRSATLSSIITIVLVVAIIFLPLAGLSTLLVNESISLYQKVTNTGITNTVDNVSNWLSHNQLLAPYIKTIQNSWAQYASNFTKTISIFLFDNIKSVTQNSLWFLLRFFLMLYALFFFLKDGPRMLKCLMHLSPLGDKYETMLYEKFSSTTRATLKSTLLVGGIQGTLGGILFWVTGVEGALVWCVIMIALSVIPAVGSSIVWFPAGIIMLATGNIWQGILILFFGLTVISLIDNFLRPIFVGRDTQMHPMLALFSTLGGIIIFGISGFIIGPVLASLFLAIMSIYEHHYNSELSEN